MAEQIASLYAEIGADTSKLDQGLAASDTGLQKTAQGLGALDKQVGAFGVNLGTTRDLLGGLGVALPTSPMQVFGQALSFSVGQAAEAEEVLAQTEAVIKSTGGAAGVTSKQVTSLAAALQNESRFADDAIQKGENLLLTFTNIGGDVFPEATKAMVDMAAALGTDVAGGAIQLGKALNDPVAGITALQRVGVSFTDSQKDVIRSLVQTGDVAGAQKIILAELNKEFGGSAAAAADTYAGSIDQAKNALGDLGEVAGGVVLPVLTDGITVFTDWARTVTAGKQALDEGRWSLGDWVKASAEVVWTGKTLADVQAELAASATAATAASDAYTAQLAEQDPAVVNARQAIEAATTATANNDASVAAQTARLQAQADMYETRTTPAAYGYLTATDLLSEGLAGLTEQMVFNQAAAGLSSEAALQLGISMGLVDTRVLALNEALPVLKAKYDENKNGAIDAGAETAAYSAAVNALRDAILSVPAYTAVEVHTNFTSSGSPQTNTGSGGAVPAGPPTAPIPQATGGDWMVSGPTLFLAGEAGPERATFTPLGGGSGGGGDSAELLAALRSLPGAVGRAVRDAMVGGQ